MSFTLKNGTACRTSGVSEACSSIATSKSVLLSVVFSYLRSHGSQNRWFRPAK
jgi:hypothetical protein